MDVKEEITLRHARPEDIEFLFSLLKAALGPYIEQAYGAWREAEQHARFIADLRLENYQVVEIAGQPVGCLAVEWLPDQIKLDRVFLLPGFQGRGIGSHLVRQVLAEARAVRLPVRLRVMKVNPAQRLWRRLGFAVVGETETHWLMEHAAENQEITGYPELRHLTAEAERHLVQRALLSSPMRWLSCLPIAVALAGPALCTLEVYWDLFPGEGMALFVAYWVALAASFVIGWLVERAAVRYYLAHGGGLGNERDRARARGPTPEPGS